MNIPTHKLINDLRLCADSTADCVCCDFSNNKPHCIDRLLEYTANRLEEFERIKQMSVDEFAKTFELSFWCDDCDRGKELTDNPLLQGELCDDDCYKHFKKYLESEVEE